MTGSLAIIFRKRGTDKNSNPFNIDGTGAENIHELVSRLTPEAVNGQFTKECDMWLKEKPENVEFLVIYQTSEAVAELEPFNVGNDRYGQVRYDVTHLYTHPLEYGRGVAPTWGGTE